MRTRNGSFAGRYMSRYGPPLAPPNAIAPSNHIRSAPRGFLDPNPRVRHSTDQPRSPHRWESIIRAFVSGLEVTVTVGRLAIHDALPSTALAIG
jgi:hypothetical protein